VAGETYANKRKSLIGYKHYDWASRLAQKYSADLQRFWHGPFCWVDNTTICIWGHEDFLDAHDIPLDTAALYDVTTGTLLRWFSGPTIDIFYFDQYLFSGSTSKNTLTVWDVNSGALMHREENLSPINYHPDNKTFLTLSEEGEILLTQWSKPHCNK